MRGAKIVRTFLNLRLQEVNNGYCLRRKMLLSHRVWQVLKLDVSEKENWLNFLAIYVNPQCIKKPIIGDGLIGTNSMEIPFSGNHTLD